MEVIQDFEKWSILIQLFLWNGKWTSKRGLSESDEYVLKSNEIVIVLSFGSISRTSLQFISQIKIISGATKNFTVDDIKFVLSTLKTYSFLMEKPFF